MALLLLVGALTGRASAPVDAEYAADAPAVARGEISRVPDGRPLAAPGTPPIANSAAGDRPVDDAPAMPAGTSASHLDLTGKWLLRHVVKRTDRAAYRGMVLLFRADLVQRGDRITGTAVKWRENGRPVARAARSALRIDGVVRGREVTGRFVETNAGRRTHGSFRWVYSVREGWLEGSFTTEVSSASGESMAVAIG